jgi:hypothetical protein
MNPNRENTIPLSACRNGWVYRLHSRNLTFGVFVQANSGFIGIREKFRHKYLFTEYHWDTGAPFGTVRPKEELDPAPVGLRLEEVGPLVDRETDRPVTDTRTAYPAPPAYIYADTGEPCTSRNIGFKENKALFDYMTQIEAKYREFETSDTRNED